MQKEYLKDGRLPIVELYKEYDKLVDSGWIKEEIFDYKKSLRTYAYRTRKKGKAIWLLAGVHGEEPAGPNAIALNIDNIIEIGKKVPMIVIPLINPSGYFRNWRFIHREKLTEENKWYCNDIADAEIVLLNEKGKARRSKPVCVGSDRLVKYIIKHSKDYKVRFSLNLHEDWEFEESYVYSEGQFKEKDKIALKILKILGKYFKIKKDGNATYSEKIVNGIVISNKDGTIDELFTADKIIVNGKIVLGPGTRTSIVVETPIKNTPLKRRIGAHAEIIRNLDKL